MFVLQQKHQRISMQALHQASTKTTLTSNIHYIIPTTNKKFQLL